MADTIQVLRLDLYTKGNWGWIKDGKAYRFDGVLMGDVIVLTEERVRRHTEGVGWERRLISEWEAVDAAG